MNLRNLLRFAESDDSPDVPAAFRVGRRAFAWWFAAGLLLRLLLAPLYGTQDIEWQKAWGTHAVREGVLTMYGAPDAEILALSREGKSREEIRAATQTVIPFEPYRYFRTEYLVTYPPGYIYSLRLAVGAYAAIDPNLSNGRLFNFFVNLPPLVASVLLTLLIAWFAGRAATPDAGRFAALAYWFNPLALLNSPVQGYQDPMCALFATLSVIAVLRRRPAWACVFLALGVMIKPQAVFVAPVVIAALLARHPLRANLAAWLAGVASGLVVVLPYLIAGRALSVIQGVRSILDSAGDLSRQAMNLWWPVQYVANAVTAVQEGRIGWIQAIAGGRYGWYVDRPAGHLQFLGGFPVHGVGWILLAVFTAFNLRMVLLRQARDPAVIVSAAALQVYAFFILRVGAQVNHYFLLVPLLALLTVRSLPAFRAYIAVSAVFLLQDLVFYGLGRDFNYGVKTLSFLRLGWTTNLLALANVALFAALCLAAYRRTRPFPGVAASPTASGRGFAARETDAA